MLARPSPVNLMARPSRSRAARRAKSRPASVRARQEPRPDATFEPLVQRARAARLAQVVVRVSPSLTVSGMGWELFESIPRTAARRLTHRLLLEVEDGTRELFRTRSLDDAIAAAERLVTIRQERVIVEPVVV